MVRAQFAAARRLCQRLWACLGAAVLQRPDESLRQHLAALQAANDEIRDLYHNAPCGYHSVDTNGIIVRMNDTELRWLGYTRDEVVGKRKLTDLLTARSLRTFAENFERFKRVGSAHDLEFELVRKDGTVLPVSLSATAITDADGNYVASRSTMFDVTARRPA